MQGIGAMHQLACVMAEVHGIPVRLTPPVCLIRHRVDGLDRVGLLRQCVPNTRAILGSEGGSPAWLVVKGLTLSHAVISDTLRSMVK